MAVAVVHALIVLLSCLGIGIEGIQPVTSQKFHGNKVNVYKYTAVVKAGQNEPAPFGSQFLIQGKLIQGIYIGDSKLKSVNYLKFSDVKHSLYNGPDDGQINISYRAMGDAIKDFEEPILVVLNEDGKLQGVKIQDKEATWSKNMKKALASIVQLDIKKLKFHKNTILPASFRTIEKTIHGDCQINYDAYSKTQGNKQLNYVLKTYEPRSCSKYVQYVATDTKNMHCGTPLEEDLVTSSEQIYEFNIIDGKLHFTKIISTEKSSYLPYLHRSAGIQYVETKQIFEFEKFMHESELNELSNIDFQSIPITDDITFDTNDLGSADKNYVGHNVIKPQDLIEKVKELLIAMVNYLRENQIDGGETSPEQTYLLQELHHQMQNLDSDSMYHVYQFFNSKTDKENMIRKIFLEIIPHTGTHAAWNFTKNMIFNKEISDDATAIKMLNNLPIFVLNPNEEFVKNMIQFRNFPQEFVSSRVIHAGILCYSILLHKTYKNVGKNVPEFLKGELDYFNDQIKNNPSYKSKIVYIMAMRNVEVGNIYQYLAPIVNREYVFEGETNSEYLNKYQIAAMWAVANSINRDKDLTRSLFLPILANTSLPLSLRITAYELLVPRNSKLDMNLLMNIYWLMVEEKNAHVFNYHYTTMKSMAESTDPCMRIFSEMTRKVFRLTKRRKFISSELSNTAAFDYFDDKYGYGKTFKVASVRETSMFPEIGYYEVISLFQKSRLDTGIYWNVEGVNWNFTMSLIKSFANIQENVDLSLKITNEKVRLLLEQTYGYKLPKKKFHSEFWTISKGYVTNVEVFFEDDLKGLFKALNPGYLESVMGTKEKFNPMLLDVSYYNQYKMIVASNIGVPVIFHNESPFLYYLKLKSNIYTLQMVIAMKLEFEAKAHYHGSYQMKIFNPFDNFTHSIRRDITADFALPFEVTISFNFKTYNWKMILPRLPETRYSVAGIKTYTIDKVEIGKDFKGALKNYCSHCKNLIDITQGPTYKTKYEKILHIEENGLEYKFSIFDCENEHTSRIEFEEIFRILETKINNADDDLLGTITLYAHHELYNFIHAPYSNMCKKMVKISPSTVYPTSHIEMNWQIIIKPNLDNGTNIGIEGSIDTKATVINRTNRRINRNKTGPYWDVNIETDISQFVNGIKLQFTRSRPEEKYLKVCFDARKLYPNLALDRTAKLETNTFITFTTGYAANEYCSFDNSVSAISATIKGELLDEQIERNRNNALAGSCFKNPMNPLDLDVTQDFDWNCLYEAVKGTTMRKYTVDASYKNIPQNLLNSLKIVDNHTEIGNIQISVNYSLNNCVNLTIKNPYSSYEVIDFEYGSKDNEKKLNDLILDNVGFSTSFLSDFYEGKIRPCIAHINNIITDTNETIPMDFNDWTLLSGEYETMSHAIFVKNNENKLWLEIYVARHVLKIQPGDNEPVIILDNKVITTNKEGLSFPITDKEKNFFKLKVANHYRSLMIEIEMFWNVKIFYTPRNVAVFSSESLSNNIDGICGHMGTTLYTQSIPLVLDEK